MENFSIIIYYYIDDYCYRNVEQIKCFVNKRNHQQLYLNTKEFGGIKFKICKFDYSITLTILVYTSRY